MKRKLLLTLLLIVICCSFSDIVFRIRNYSTDPEGCLLQALKEHKVVMLGDFCHGAALPHKTVIWLLQRWLDDLKNGNIELRHLTLVLECDDSEIVQIKNFIENKQLPSPEVLSINHLEKLEFFADLRKIVQEIDRRNNLETEDRKINFCLLGPESEVDKEIVYLESNLADGVNYFVRKRDILSSKKIIEYANANPDHKFLFFYGNAHLQRGLRNKDLWSFFPDKDLKDYYLIYYLERSFGKKEVFSVDQVDFDIRRTDSKICEILTGKSSNNSVFFFSNKLEMWFSNLFSGKCPADALIVRRTQIIQPMQFSSIPLLTNVRRCLDRLEQLKDATGFLAKKDKGEMKRILQYVTGKKAESISEWQKILNDGDFVSWIEAEKRPLSANGFYNSSSESFEKVLGKVSASFRKIRNHKPEVLECQLIRNLFCVGTMWAGDDREKAFAKNELLKESGIDSNQPGEYLIWVRKKYFLVNY